MKKETKTTKEFLDDALKGQKRTPLYNPAVLAELRQTFAKWQQESVRPQDRKNWQITPKMVLGSQIPRDLLYTPLSNPEFDYTEDLGNSGQEPYTRGLTCKHVPGPAI
jgi:methylmalonyl-CoA mutase N-terminal domain/subunit